MDMWLIINDMKTKQNEDIIKASLRISLPDIYIMLHDVWLYNFDVVALVDVPNVGEYNEWNSWKWCSLIWPQNVIQ